MWSSLRPNQTFVLMAVVIACGVTQTVCAASDLPLPKGAIALLSGPSEVRLGRRTMEVQSFSVEMEEEAIVAFYEQALPQYGWRLEKLPRRVQHEAAMARIERALSTHRDARGADKVETRLKEMRETQIALRKQIHASQGAEHVIVNLIAMGDVVGIFLNRWSGEYAGLTGAPRAVAANPNVQVDHSRAHSRSALRPSPAVTGQTSTVLEAMVAGSRDLLHANVCCSDDSVPELENELPFGLPLYPGARAAAQSTPAGGERTIMFFMTPDRLEQVIDYFREQMRHNGWYPLDDRRRAAGPNRASQLLRYRQKARICEIAIEGAVIGGNSFDDQNAGVSGETTITMSVGLSSSASQRGSR